jgi:pilus assembly protein CpaD
MKLMHKSAIPERLISCGHLAMVAAVSCAALSLSACSKNRFRAPQVAGWALVDTAQRHPIRVSQEPQTMTIQVPRNSRGLTPKQRAELLDFAHRARASDAGNSRIVISAPSGGRNEVEAMYAVGQVRQILSDIGFSEGSIAVEAQYDGATGSPPIRVSYLRYVAEGPECGSWPTNLAHEPNNLPYPNMGCATQHNFAAMVANPSDLLGPRTQSDRPSERRDAVWGKYVKGESTVAEKTEDEKVKSSK